LQLRQRLFRLAASRARLPALRRGTALETIVNNSLHFADKIYVPILFQCRYNEAGFPPRKLTAMLVLLSSGATPRYRDDIIRILALPAGADLQFRYDRRYIDAALLKKIESGDVRDEEAVALYLWSDKDKLHTELVPCRFVRVVGAEFAGSSCIIRLRAENFVTGLDDSKFRATLKAEESSLLPQWEAKPEVGPVLNGKFFFPIQADLSKCATNNITAFEETAKSLARYKDFSDARGTLFFTVRRLTKIERGDRLSTTRGAQPLGGSYELLSGQSYAIEIYSFVPPTIELKAARLHIDSDVSAVEFPLGHQLDIDSRYDLKRFPFQVQEQIRSISAGLRIYVTDPENKDVRSDILVPVRFNGSLLFAIARTALIAIGTSGTGIVAASAAGKLDTNTGVLICAFGLVAAAGTVFNSLRGG
jgi:hypothetical protein